MDNSETNKDNEIGIEDLFTGKKTAQIRATKDIQAINDTVTQQLLAVTARMEDRTHYNLGVLIPEVTRIGVELGKLYVDLATSKEYQSATMLLRAIKTMMETVGNVRRDLDNLSKLTMNEVNNAVS